MRGFGGSRLRSEIFDFRNEISGFRSEIPDSGRRRNRMPFEPGGGSDARQKEMPACASAVCRIALFLCCKNSFGPECRRPGFAAARPADSAVRCSSLAAWGLFSADGSGLGAEFIAVLKPGRAAMHFRMPRSAPPAPSVHPFQRLPSTACYGLPQRGDGRLGQRRCPRLRMGIVAVCFRTSQCRAVAYRCGPGGSVVRFQPELRFLRALRPSICRCFSGRKTGFGSVFPPGPCCPPVR